MNIVPGSSDTYTVLITADGASVEGLIIEGGSSTDYMVKVAGAATVNNCTIIDDGNQFDVSGVELWAGATLSDCTITLTSGYGRAVMVCGSSSSEPTVVSGNVIAVDIGASAGSQVEGVFVNDAFTGVSYTDVTGNQIEFDGAFGDAGVGILIDEDAYHTDITDNYIIGGNDGVFCIATFDTDISGNVFEDFDFSGVRLFGGDVAVTNNTMIRGTCISGPDGIRIEPPFSTSASEFENNLFVDLSYGIYVIQASISGYWVISHNAYWETSAGCGSKCNKTLTGTECADDLEPIFCDAKEAPVAKYSHRIDSAIAPGNNGWSEMVGAYGMECAWGTLQYDATLLSNESALVLEDVTVPTGKTLTMGPGSALEFDEDDNSSGGASSTENELIVNGTLDVNGTSGNHVEFVSAKTSQAAGDWERIEIKSGGEATIDYAVVKHGTIGVKYGSNEAGHIKNSIFSDNESYDVLIGSPGAAQNDVTVSDNTITVGGGSGIELWTDYVDGTIVENNTISGSSASSNGIVFNTYSTGTTPIVKGNTITGFTNGAGILTVSDAAITQNTCTGNKWGIKVTAGTPTLGSSSSSSDNVLEENTTGIFVDGSTATPKVRNNKIRTNSFGVLAKGNGNPDLGQSASDPGNNTFTGNTSYCIWNRNKSGTLSAQYNYFGTCIGGLPPSALCINGSVDVANGLCTEPASRSFEIGPVDVGTGIRLLGVQPNPISAGGAIVFTLSEDATRVGARIFDVAGRLVRTYPSRVYGPGEHRLGWDGRDGGGRPVRGGIYFVRLEGPGVNVRTAKVLVAR